MDSQNHAEGEESSNLSSLPTPNLGFPNDSVRANSGSLTYEPLRHLVSEQNYDLTQPQSLVASIPTVFVLVMSNLFGFVCRVAPSIKSVNISPMAIALGFGNGFIVEDACYIEYVEGRNLWRAAKCPSKIELRMVEESELTPGCKDLITKAGCAFKTSSGTPKKISRPIEVPSNLLRYVMRSLGFDVVYKGDLFFMYGPRYKRPISSIVVIAPKVDQNEQNGFSEALGVHVEDHIINTYIKVIVGGRVTTVLHVMKARCRDMPLTDIDRKDIRSKLRPKNGSMVLI